MKIIEVHGVSKNFEIVHQKRDTLKENFIGFLRRNENRKEVIPALKDINFDVERGECVGIVGENASGKTTLLKVVGNFLSPSNGKVTVRGKIAPLLTLGVGFDPELTAKENVYLYGSLMGLSQKQIDDKYESIVKFSELEKFMNTKLKNFSSGMAVRLGFATAINVEADILLVDEVLSVGDGAFQRKCLDKFEEFKKEGRTILFVSHGLDPIKTHCDRAIFLHRGQIKAIGETMKIVELYEHYLTNKQTKLHNSEILRKMRERGGRDPRIKEFKMLNDENEEDYFIKSGGAAQMLFVMDGAPPCAVFTITIHKDGGNIVAFSKDVDADTVSFKFDSLPLSAGEYAISIGCLGGTDISGQNRFKFSVSGETRQSSATRLFIENPVTINKELLAFGERSEITIEDFEKGGAMICFETIEEAKNDTKHGTLFFGKAKIFSGGADDVVELYKKRIYESAVKILNKSLS